MGQKCWLSGLSLSGSMHTRVEVIRLDLKNMPMAPYMLSARRVPLT